MIETTFAVGDYVLNKADSQTYRITSVDGGSITAARPGHKADRVILPAHSFISAPTSARIEYVLAEHGVQCDVRLFGKDPRAFRLVFQHPVANATLDNIRRAGLKILSHWDDVVNVTIPDGWLSTSEAELLTDEPAAPAAPPEYSDDWEKSFPEPDSSNAEPLSPLPEFGEGQGLGFPASDPDLTATAQLIADLRARLAHAEATIADLEARRDQPAPAGPPRVEVRIVSDITDAVFEMHLNDGWTASTVGFTTSGEVIHTNVVFTRPARPASLSGSRAARPVHRPSTILPPVAPPPPTRAPVQLAPETGGAGQAFPIASALRAGGLAAVEAAMNDRLADVGRAAYEAHAAAHPLHSYSLIPSGV